VTGAFSSATLEIKSHLDSITPWGIVVRKLLEFLKASPKIERSRVFSSFIHPKINKLAALLLKPGSNMFHKLRPNTFPTKYLCDTNLMDPGYPFLPSINGIGNQRGV
jgi:hypothetical protein